MRSEIVSFLESSGLLDDMDVPSVLERPQDESHGDWALPLFTLAKTRRQNPVQIAAEVASALDAIKPESIARIEAAGAYVNITVSDEALARHALAVDGEKLDVLDEKIVLEYSQPNTNKPLHIGHMRNMLLGKALIATLRRGGARVVPVVLYNDRGIAICKSMLAYERFGNGATPESTGVKGDHFVGSYYRLFGEKAVEDPSLEAEAQRMLERWEAGDPEVRALWSTMNDWALEGMHETFRHFSLEYEKEYFESAVYAEGARIVKQGLADGVFATDKDGNVVYEKPDGRAYTLLRPDGTALYITQDLALAKSRAEEFDADRYVYVVGNEQAYHFETLFEILDALGIAPAERFEHYAYGMVTLPEGKMSSRSGRVVYADDIIAQTIERAKAEIVSRDPELGGEALETRAAAVAFGALNFFILKHNPLEDVVYDADRSVSFEGETGPYVQYAVARIASILKEAEATDGEVAWGALEPQERAVLRRLGDYRSVVEEAAARSKPSHIALYVLDLAQRFNSFYHACRVLGSEEEARRLAICRKVSEVLSDGLSLLDIEPLEAM